VIALALVLLCFSILGGVDLVSTLWPMVKASSIGLWVMFIAMVLCGVSVALHPKAVPANGAHAHAVPAAAH
jgi:hypothetical protein